MAATANYFDAAYPEPWQVLGINLKPFSLGHYVKLYRLGCAFVADEVKQATLGDLLLGVAVCSMDSHPDPSKDDFWNWLNREEPEGWRKFVFKLGRMFGAKLPTPAELDMARLGRRVGSIDFSEKAKVFAEYVEAHSKAPAYWDTSAEGSRTAGGHWSQSIIYTMVSKCGYTPHEAYNVPLSKALADFFKHAESEGCVRLMTQDERKALGL